MIGTKCPDIGGFTWIKGSPVAVGGDSAAALGRVTVVEFFGTWCPPCRETIPHLTAIQKRFASRGVVIVGVSTEEVAKVRPFVEKTGDDMGYLVVVDTGRQAHTALYQPSKAGGIPHAFILDHQNLVVYSGHPGEPAFEQTLRDTVVKAEAALQAAKVALPTISSSFEQLMELSAKELKTTLQDRGISLVGCIEKSDLANKIVKECSNVTYYK